MASTSKRPPNLNSLNAQPKPVVSVEEWEASAPIGDLEVKSVNYIQAASERAALPPKVRTHEVTQIVCSL